MALPAPDEQQQLSTTKPNAVQRFWKKSKNSKIEKSEKIEPVAVAAATATATEAASSTTSLTTEGPSASKLVSINFHSPFDCCDSRQAMP